MLGKLIASQKPDVPGAIMRITAPGPAEWNDFYRKEKVFSELDIFCIFGGVTSVGFVRFFTDSGKG
jgi:hypothetical protein